MAAVRTDQKEPRQQPIYVFQMGKVGSTSIARSLQQIGLPIIHCQWLSDHNQAFFRTLVGSDDPVLQASIDHYDRCRAQLADRNYARSLKVVTVAREPLSQILSHYFHNFSTFLPYIEKNHVHVNTETICRQLADLSRYFISLVDNHPAALTRQLLDDGRLDRTLFSWLSRNPLRWFDEELWPYFGTDVYAHRPFSDKAIDNVLLLKFEDLGTRAEMLLADFLGIPGIQILRSNVGSDRVGPLYTSVIHARPFPREFAEAVHSSLYARHFYDERELTMAAERLSR